MEKTHLPNEESDAVEPIERALLTQLHSFPLPTQYWVACSGGSDSAALLHAMARVRGELRAPVVAVHVNHGLHPEADTWQSTVEDWCEQLDIPCYVLVVAVELSGRGVEDAAREARYHAIGEAMATNEMLLTAHHRDDQVETFLLQLLRGAGPHGLGAMRACREFSGGWLGRPLLEETPGELQDYCLTRGCEWVDDPSNDDRGLRRNFLRHDIIPALRKEWPAVGEVLRRNASLQRESAVLLDEMAANDLVAAIGEGADYLHCEQLAALSPPRATNLVRYWLASRHFALPGRQALRGLVTAIHKVKPDSEFELRWRGGVARIYRERLYAERVVGRKMLAEDDCLPRTPWALPQPLTWGGGELSAAVAAGSGLSVQRLWGRTVEARQREGGERCQPVGRGVKKRLKTLLQEAGVPPWERRRLPLIYVDGELACVPGVCYAEQFAATGDEAGWEILWAP